MLAQASSARKRSRPIYFLYLESSTGPVAAGSSHAEANRVKTLSSSGLCISLRAADPQRARQREACVERVRLEIGARGAWPDRRASGKGRGGTGVDRAAELDTEYHYETAQSCSTCKIAW